MTERDVVLLLIGMGAGLASSLMTGVAVRVALGARRQKAHAGEAGEPEPAFEAGSTREIAIALAAVCRLREVT